MSTNFTFKLYALLFSFVTAEDLQIASLLIVLLTFACATNGIKAQLKIAMVIIGTALSAFMGARILHVFIEKPELLNEPEKIFSRFDGMTFNGSLLFGLITFSLGLKLFNRSQKDLYWDLAAVMTALSYGIMRVGCFITGCCWGKISAVAWSVRYPQSNVMPWLGLPVHPVQLYDAALGATIAIILFIFKKKELFRGKLFSLFLVLYSVGRFFTEQYRGDSFRGENWLLNLSTSQLVSVVLFIAGLLSLRQFVKIRCVAFSISTLFLTGCLLPTAPSNQEFKKVQKNYEYEVYKTKKVATAPKRNVLFVAADETLQFQLKDQLQEVYKSHPQPRVEELAWWISAKKLMRNYNLIVRIPPQKLTYNNFINALLYIQSQKTEYDIFILTHGLPNHLSTGIGYFLSFRELAQLEGQLTSLRMVFMQSCYSTSLTKDWQKAGAKYVISFDETNFNFAFYDIFLSFSSPENSVAQSYYAAKDNLSWKLKNNIPYYYFIPFLQMQLSNSLKNKVSMDEAIQMLPAPRLTSY